MSRHENYRDGVLTDLWDDDTRTYTRWDDAGAVVETRPYTEQENQAADAAAAAHAERVNESATSQKLQRDMDAIQAILDQTNADLRDDPARAIKDLAHATRRLIRRVENLYDGSD
jgi:hypothetical protein